MGSNLAALAPPPFELPTAKCAKCGGTAKLTAFDRAGTPIYVCTDPKCKGTTLRTRMT